MSDRRIPMVAEVQPVAEPKPEESYGTAVMHKTKKKHTGLMVFLCLSCVLLATLLALHLDFRSDRLRLQPGAQPAFPDYAPERELTPNAEARPPIPDSGRQKDLWLGFAVEEIPQNYCVYYGFPGTVWITQVGTGSYADGALSAYDVIMSVDGIGIASKEDFESVLSGHKIGDILELRIFRTGCYYTIKLPLTGN